MANEIYFPFNSQDDEFGIPDRAYDMSDFANYFSQFISNGVFPNPSTGLKVQSLYANMVLTVAAGNGYIDGHGYTLDDEDGEFTIQVNSSHVSYNRKDIVVLQLDLTARKIIVVYKPGTASANPLPPSVVRNADIYELKLADILVRSGTQSLTQADITDTRLDGTVCGIVHATVTSVDTTKLFNQYEVYLNQKIAEWDVTKSHQGADWQGQMTSQQIGFNTQKNEIQGWYDSVKVDIAKLQTFDFDNLSSFPGTYLTESRTLTSYLSEIRFTATDKLIANKMETKGANTYITTINIYKTDGVTVDKTTTMTESKVGENYRTVIV